MTKEKKTTKNKQEERRNVTLTFNGLDPEYWLIDDIIKMKEGLFATIDSVKSKHMDKEAKAVVKDMVDGYGTMHYLSLLYLCLNKVFGITDPSAVEGFQAEVQTSGDPDNTDHTYSLKIEEL